MTKESQTKTGKTFNLLITILLIPIVSAFSSQSHPGEEIVGELTDATLSCANIQQSYTSDDDNFCVDLDTRCDATSPCTTLCLNEVCIDSFSEINATGSTVEADCAGSGFLRLIDGDTSICEEVTTDDIVDGTITQDDLGFTIEGGVGSGYCPDGTCLGDLYIPSGNHLKLDAQNQIQFMVGGGVAAAVTSFSGADKIGLQTGGNTHLLVDESGKVRIGDTSTASSHILGVKTSSGLAVIDISSPAGETSAVDFMEGSTAKWGIGKDNSNNFYIDEDGATNVLNVIPGGSLTINRDVGIGTASPSEALDVDGNIVASGTICDGVGACVGDSFWIPSGDDIYYDAGNVGIGVSDPDADLEINGQIKITGGNPGSNKVLTSDADGLASWQYDGIPAGAVMFFNLVSCPSGWSELVSARGRYLVAKPDGGTLGATVGTALSDQENRPVGQHDHDITDPGHTHRHKDAAGYSLNPLGGSTTWIKTDPGPTASNTTGITINNEGAVEGTNAPYIQFLVCQKD
jgi:hypothetical protein